ncbi:MAG: class I SAM-dependent methyltransferase [Mycobacteriales bacterium]
MLTPGLLDPERSSAYVKYALFGQRRVHGWLSDVGLRLVDAAEAVQQEHDVHGNLAEIGVHHGRLFILLCLAKRDSETALAIDLFEDQEFNIDNSGKGDRAKLEANLRRWYPDGTGVEIVKGNSLELGPDDLQRMANGPLRLMSVDGGHTVEITMNDLEISTKALVPGGIVVLDDCFSDFFPSVAEGAQNFLRDNREYQVFACGGNKTLITDREHASAFRDSVVARFKNGPVHVEERIFMGNPVIAIERWPELSANLLYWRSYVRDRAARVVRERGFKRSGRA